MRFVAGVGKANVDLLYGGMPRVPGEGEEIYAESFSMQLGGGIPATLVNLGRLGVPCRIQTFLGEDLFSRFAREAFSQNGVTPASLYAGRGIPVNVTCAVITPRDRAFISYSDSVAIGDKELSAVYEASRGAAIVLMHEDFLPIYPGLKREGAVLVYDTGWREDMSEQSMRGVLELADWYTPNAREAMKITGESTPLAAAKRLGRYLETPVVKLDKDGCLLLENGKATVVPALPDIRCVDPTGAGDAFLSGFTYGLFHRAPPALSALYGNIAGSECVMGIGCLSRYVNEEQLLARARAFEHLIKA